MMHWHARKLHRPQRFHRAETFKKLYLAFRILLPCDFLFSTKYCDFVFTHRTLTNSCGGLHKVVQRRTCFYLVCYLWYTFSVAETRTAMSRDQIGQVPARLLFHFGGAAGRELSSRKVPNDPTTRNESYEPMKVTTGQKTVASIMVDSR